MAASDARVTYSSLSKLDKENTTNFGYDAINHQGQSVWIEPKPGTTCGELGSTFSDKEMLYQFPSEDDDLFDGGYESGDDARGFVPSKTPPEVNLKNVLSGMFAILTGRNKGPSPRVTANQDSNVSFFDSGKNGDVFLDSSVYTPSAPPLCLPNGSDYSSYKEVLEADPPTGSLIVLLMFVCSVMLHLLERNPQRVCDACYDRLDPLQGVLINTISNAAQVAKHDVMDWTCARGWINLPIGLSMEHEIYKASNTLRNYCQVAKSNPEKSIPLTVLKSAKGLAVLTVAKAGALVSYKLGTGLVVSRRSDGSWSAPSAIFSLGLGWGAQIGGELMDFIVVLRDMKAVKTFCSRMHLSLGAGCSAAAGPVGRVLEADIRAGDRGTGMCYTYSCSKGAFVGVSLEGNIVATRMDANLRFYGDPYLTTSDILLGMVDRPKAAQPLYASLQELYSCLRF
ncbi:hypothetical protein ACSQ67_006425 [Phaseolus vulgaris]